MKKYNVVFLCGFAVLLILSYQQCSPNQAHNVSETLQSISSSPVDTDTNPANPHPIVEETCQSSKNSPSEFVCPSAQLRRKAFLAKYSGWDFEWNGEGTPASIPRYYHTWFDNPYEDDYEEHPESLPGLCRMHFNTPKIGLMTFNKYFYNEGATQKKCPKIEVGKGWFMRRDPFLDTTKGLTFEFRLRVPDYKTEEQNDIVLFQFNGRRGAHVISFTPGVKGCVKISNPGQGGMPLGCVSNKNFTAIPWNVSEWTIYRVTFDAGTGLGYSIRMTNRSSITAFTKEVRGLGTQFRTVAYYAPGEIIPSTDSRNEFSNFTFGVHRENVGAYELDYIRYTQGLVQPGVDMPMNIYEPPSIPINIPVPSHAGEIKSQHWVTNRSEPIMSPQGIKGNGDWTLELKARAGENLSSRGFAVVLMERMGALALVISKDKVELSMGYKTMSYSQPVYLDATKETTYRLIKYGHLPYVYLYINNEKRPVIADFKLSGFAFNSPDQTQRTWEGNEMVIRYGWYAHRMPQLEEYGPAPIYKPFALINSTMDMHIQHLRWSPQAVPSNQK